MTTKYRNGYVPQSALVMIEGDDLHWSSPYAAHQFILMRDWIKAEYGVTVHITEGKNAYRDMAGQVFARNGACAAGNCLGAADPGTSSHGGTWKNQTYTSGVEVDAMAFDVGDWSQLKQATWYAAAEKFGFVAGAITPDIAGGYEPWHIIMFEPWRAVPAPAPKPIQEDDMAYPFRVDKKHMFLVAPGSIKHFNSGDAADLTMKVVSSADKWIDLSAAAFATQLDSFGIPRSVADTTKGGVLDVSKGAIVSGGFWSWDRAADAKAAKILAAIDTPKA